MKKLSDRQHEVLALHATYSFKHDEGENAVLLLCEIANNIDVSKFKDKDINPNKLSAFITEQLIKTIKSRKFQASLKAYSQQEIAVIKQA